LPKAEKNKQHHYRYCWPFPLQILLCKYSLRTNTFFDIKNVKTVTITPLGLDSFGNATTNSTIVSICYHIAQGRKKQEIPLSLSLAFFSKKLGCVNRAQDPTLSLPLKWPQ
jgi:hypothetical protein